jgi:hypothetical protein
MKRTLLALALFSMAALTAAAAPPGDTTVQQIKIVPAFPADTRLEPVEGQYELLANQLQLLHESAEFRQDPAARTLYAKVANTRAVTIKHNSDFITVPALAVRDRKARTAAAWAEKAAPPLNPNWTILAM